MNDFIKFPSIEQFRHAIKATNERTPGARVPYEGTIKLHGTNAGVRVLSSGEVRVQSRNGFVTEGNHFGFVEFVAEREDVFRHLGSALFGKFGGCIFGEWVGPGIQKGVGVSALPEKRFAVFAAASAEDCWVPIGDGPFGDRIDNVGDCGRHYIEIDFVRPEIAQAKMVEITEAVEARCPYAAMHGVDGIGEGVVWRPVMISAPSRYWFKVKGEKHSVTKVRTLAAPDVEKMASARAFVDAVVTDARCEQGLAHLRELGLDVVPESTGAFLQWVGSDVMKEEADTLEASGLTRKDVGGLVAKAAREWFFARAS